MLILLCPTRASTASAVRSRATPSRKVVGWALGDHLEARLAVDALDEAIEARDPPPGLIHHSDRGIRYASTQYAARLLDERR